MARKKRRNGPTDSNGTTDNQASGSATAATASLAGTVTAGAGSSKSTKRKSWSSSSAAQNRTSRLQPSVPLHMTTRRRASKSASMHSVSSLSGGSRDHSVTNDSTPEIDVAPEDLVTQGPPKRRRLTDQHAHAASQQATIKLSPNDTNSSNPFSLASSEDNSGSKLNISEEEKEQEEEEEDDDEEDVDAASLSSVAGAAEVAVEQANAQQPSLEPPRKRLRGRPPKQPRTENSDLSLKDGDEVDMAPVPLVKRPPGRPRGRGGKAPVVPRPPAPKSGGRLPGRRRANLDAQLEADLLRQAALKKNYRALVRALKPALYELGERTQKDLEDDDRAHEKYAQYQMVQQDLDRRLETRLACIEAEYRLKKDQRAVILQAQQEILENDLQRQFEDIKDDFIAYIQAEYLKIVRQMNARDDGEATDDEDMTAVSPEKMCEPVPGTSRSSIFRATERSWSDVEVRARFGTVLAAYAPDLAPASPSHFATFNADVREAGIVAENVDRLADACAEIDEATRRADAAAALKEKGNTLEVLSDAIEHRHPAVWTPKHRSKQDAPHAAVPKTPASTKHSGGKVDHDVTPTPRRVAKSGHGRGKHGSVSKVPITPEHRVQRNLFHPQDSASRETPTAPVRHETEGRRTEPKMGFFMTPKAGRTSSPDSRHPRRHLAPIDTSPSSHRGVVAAKESPSKPRIIAPKKADEGASQPPKPRTNTLASILNFDDPPPMRPRANSGRAPAAAPSVASYAASVPAAVDGPHHPPRASPYVSSSQLPPLPAPPSQYTPSYHAAPPPPPPLYEQPAPPPRPYQGYEQSGPVHYSASLPPPPPPPPPPPAPHSYGSPYAYGPGPGPGPMGPLPPPGVLAPPAPLHPASSMPVNGGRPPLPERPYYDRGAQWGAPILYPHPGYGPPPPGAMGEQGGRSRHGSIASTGSTLPPPPPPPSYAPTYGPYPPRRI